MKKIIICLLIVLMILPISYASVTRSLSKSSVTSGETFTITYTSTGVDWSLKERLPSNCQYKDGSVKSPDGYLRDGPVSGTILSHTASCTTTSTFNDGYYLPYGATSWSALSSNTLTVGGTCTPNCAGKSCGSDGCTGTCGTCATGQTCSNGVCSGSGGTGSVTPLF